MNFKVLIVDDDLNYRYAMKNIIPWEESGFQIVAEAINGKHAMQILDEKEIDLVITDMSMPQMDGVELIKMAKDKYPDIVFIALSAYDDFEFVKESLKCGAEDYILKYELEEKAIMEMILDLKEELMKIQKEKKLNNLIKNKDFLWVEDIFQKIFGTKNISGQQLRDFLQIFDIPIQSPKMIVCIVVTECEITEEDINKLWNIKEEKIVAGRMGDRQVVIILDFSNINSNLEVHRNMSQILRQVRRELYSNDHSCVTIGVSNICYKVQDINNAYCQARLAIDNQIYMGKNRDFYYNAETDKEEKEFLIDYNRFRQAVENKDIGQMRKALNDAMEEIQEKRPGAKLLDKIIVDIYFTVYMASLEGGICETITTQQLDKLSSEIEQSVMLMEKVQILMKYIESLFMELNKDLYMFSCDIRRAILYIREHYMEDITLCDISAHVGLSENYLSNLFKQETGENIIRYINKLRVNQAKKLITETNMRVYEIAAQVGFKNVTYFSTVFKQYTNMTISEFKNSKKLNK